MSCSSTSSLINRWAVACSATAASADFNLRSSSLQFAVFEFGGLIEVVLSLGLLDGELGLFDLLAQIAELLHALLFLLASAP